MDYTRKFAFATETLLAITVVSILTVACGGGNSGGNTTSSNSSGGGSGGGGGLGSISSTNAVITPYKGPFIQGATVDLRDANGNLVALLSGGTIDANGVANVSYKSNVAYPLTVEVTGTYYNEISGFVETSTVPIRGLITDSSATSAVPITVVTETAVANLESTLGSFTSVHPNVSYASAVAALSLASNELGISYTSVPVFDSVTHLPISADAVQLTALAKVANDTQVGANLAAKISALANTFANLNPASAPTDVISQTTINNALTAVTSGASSVLAVGITAPSAPIINNLYVDSIPVFGASQLRAGTIAKWNAYVTSPTVVAAKTFPATSLLAQVERFFIHTALAAQSL